MKIKELHTGDSVIVKLDYDELRCINNSLYELSRYDDLEKDDNLNDVRAKFIELFALVKHGKIPEFELDLIYKLLCNQQEYPTEKGGGEE